MRRDIRDTVRALTNPSDRAGRCGFRKSLAAAQRIVGGVRRISSLTRGHSPDRNVANIGGPVSGTTLFGAVRSGATPSESCGYLAAFSSWTLHGGLVPTNSWRMSSVGGSFQRWVLVAACLAAPTLQIPLAAQETARSGAYLGASTCGSCHLSQFQSQSQSGHARTLHRASDHPLADRFIPDQPVQRPPAYRFRYEQINDRIIVQADDNEFIMELPVEWAFGAGDHGVTFVSRLNKHSYLEHAFSYYSASDSLGITTGHETVRPETLLQAVGLRYTVRGAGSSISSCFQCHSTGPLSYSPQQEVEVNEAGVRCESCHGPGRDHLAAVSAGSGALARLRIGNPVRLPTDDLLRFCGDCHRDPHGGSGDFDFEIAWNVRHQPPYFRQSQCFQSSGTRLTCFTCHDPHEAVRRSQPDYYRKVCLDCHDGQAGVPTETCWPEQSPDCTDCHMPTVSVSPNLAFKNHWIGIYSGSGRLVPERRGRAQSGMVEPGR